MIMDVLPAVTWSLIDNNTFHRVFGFCGIVSIGSILACYIAQYVDIIIYLRIKKATGTKWLWLRNYGSSSISLLIDTSIVISFMTFFGIVPLERMGALIMNSYLFKLFFLVCSTPLFYASVTIIRSILGDTKTINLGFGQQNKAYYSNQDMFQKNANL